MLFEQAEPMDSVMIGREAELEEIRQQLKSPFTRLISLAGPSGVGKTSLARRAAMDSLAQFPDGTCYVPAGAMGLPSLLMRALCRDFKIEVPPQEDARATLLRKLGSRRALLILDEAVHFPDARVLVQDLMAAGPFLKILITGKSALALSGEKVISISGLGVSDGAGGSEGGSMELFLSAARKSDPDFKFSAFDRPFVGRICRLLQGNPLALGLAASMLQMLTASELCRALESDPALAEQMAKGADEGVGLTAVLSQSWSLLHQDRRRALEQLSIFERAFSRHEAEEVAQVGFTLLGLLSGKSLVQKQSSSLYFLPEAVRAFAKSKLIASPRDLENAAAAHTRYFSGLLKGLDKDLSPDAAMIEHLADFRALWRRQSEGKTWNWLSEHVDAYHALLKRSASYQELWEDFEPLLKAMDQAAGPGLRVQVLRGLGEASLPLGRPAEGQRFLLSAAAEMRLLGANFLGQRRETLGSLMALAERFGDAPGFEEALRQQVSDCSDAKDLAGQADGLRLLGLRSGMLNDSASARRHLGESAVLLRTLNNRVDLVWTLGALADLACREGDLSDSRKSAEEALSLSEATQDKAGRIWARRQLADLDMIQGESARAVRWMRESHSLCDLQSDKWTFAYFSCKLGEALCLDGRLAEALSHSGASRETFQGIHEVWGEAWATDLQGYVRALSGDLDGGLAQMQEAEQALRKLENNASLTRCLIHQSEARLAKGDAGAAWSSASESLGISQHNSSLSVSERLDLLAGAALALAGRKQARLAAAALAFILKQAALSQRSQKRAAEALSKLRQNLSPAEQKAADEAAKKMDLRAATARVLGDGAGHD